MKKLYKINQFTAEQWDGIEYDWNEHEDEIVIIEKKDAYCMDITANGKRIVPILRKIEEAMTAAGLAGETGIYAGWFGEWANELTDRRDRKYFIWNYSGQSDRERGCWSYSWGIEQIDEDRWYIFLNIAKPQEETEETETETAAPSAPSANEESAAEEQTTETDTEEEEEEQTMLNTFTPAEAAMHAATVRGIIRRKGGYRERDILNRPHTVERGETWNEAHKVVEILATTPDPDGYRPGCAVDIVTRSIVG